MDLVESHVHIWTLRDPRFGKHPDSDFKPDREAAPEDLFAAQDEVGGVAWTVLIQPRYYLWDNTYLAQAAEAHPDRFVVAGRVDPMHPDAPRQLRELMQRPGYRGIRLAATEDPATRWLDDRFARLAVGDRRRDARHHRVAHPVASASPGRGPWRRGIPRSRS